MNDRALLELWSAAQGADAWQCEALLLAAAAGDGAPRALGARHLALLRWRRAGSGRAWPMRATCPRCAGELDFELDLDALVALPHENAPPGLRAPTIDDLRDLAARHADAPAFAHALLERCAGAVPADDEQRAALVAQLEAIDPHASLALDLDCAACGHAWSEAFDVAAALWAEVAARAERVLLDVATLARCWGWSEREVLALPAARRAAYLQLATAVA